MMKKKGGVEVFLTRDYFNSLVDFLTDYIKANDAGKYGISAAKLKRKIMCHSRKFQHREEENAAIYFYENEAAVLIKLAVIYMNAMWQPEENYYRQISREQDSDTRSDRKKQ